MCISSKNGGKAGFVRIQNGERIGITKQVGCFDSEDVEQVPIYSTSTNRKVVDLLYSEIEIHRCE